MLGSYFTGIKSFEVREQSLPALGGQDVLIRVMACGVCGTDIHIYHGEPGSADVTPPVVLGHEFAGVVEKVGDHVSGLKPGDKVTVDPNIYCGECRYCHSGKKQMCEHMTAVGVNRDGGFAQYCVAPASHVLSVSNDLDLETAAMSEPLACCIHGIDLAGIRTGDTVLVIGGGAIGLLMVQLARLSGASRVIVSEPVEMRRKVALDLGADACFNPLSDDPQAEIRKLTGQDGADVIIECVGKTAATQQAFDTAAKGATILLFSVPAVDAAYQLPLFDVFKKELIIKGSFVNPDTHSRAVALLNSGKIQIAPLITHRFGLRDVEKAVLAQMGSESIKVLVLPQQETIGS